ncbi:MAG: hypothetical protein KAS04_04015 [Candidatus Aenigmarchaeota archaeon]|nr:hypothetical protein [Candidatus Aenigmarchaeota archaeon]
MAIEKIGNIFWTPPVVKERQNKNKKKDSQKNDKKKISSRKGSKEGVEGSGSNVDIRV